MIPTFEQFLRLALRVIRDKQCIWRAKVCVAGADTYWQYISRTVCGAVEYKHRLSIRRFGALCAEFGQSIFPDFYFCSHSCLSACDSSINPLERTLASSRRSAFSIDERGERTMSPKVKAIALFAIISLMCVSFCPAQYYLACRGTDQVLINDNVLFQMKDETDYQIVGIRNYGDSYGGFLIRTGSGNAEYKGNRFRVLEGGQFGTVRVGLKDVKKGIMEHWQENKMGYRSKYSWYSADWSGSLIASQRLKQCYAAFQWYANGKPVGTRVQKIGTLEANRPTSLEFSIAVDRDQQDGTYSFHVWSGGYELKTVEFEESQDKW
jgi:hypothetical protein